MLVTDILIIFLLLITYILIILIIPSILISEIWTILIILIILMTDILIIKPSKWKEEKQDLCQDSEAVTARTAPYAHLHFWPLWIFILN